MMSPKARVRLQFGRKGETADAEERPLAEGVPMPKLIKRQIQPRAELVLLSQPRSPAAEQFRRLRSILMYESERRVQTVLVTSGAPGEGKSTVAFNTALALAEAGQKTLLVDADLRRPVVGGALRPEPQMGLSELLQGRLTLDHVALTVENSPLQILPAGAKTADPAHLLSSDKSRDVLDALREHYDYIVVDTPPVLPFSDADSLGAHGDGFLFVVRSGHTGEAAMQRAVDNLKSAPILGVVFNDKVGNLADGRQYYESYYYGYYDDERRGNDDDDRGRNATDTKRDASNAKSRDRGRPAKASRKGKRR